MSWYCTSCALSPSSIMWQFETRQNGTLSAKNGPDVHNFHLEMGDFALSEKAPYAAAAPLCGDCGLPMVWDSSKVPEAEPHDPPESVYVDGLPF